MKFKALTSGLVAALIVGLPAIGSATVILTTSSNDSILDGMTSLDFVAKGSDAAACTANGYSACTGSFEFIDEPSARAKTPGTDSGSPVSGIFLTVPEPNADASLPGQATLEFGSATNQFGMLWGSVDGYNTLDLLLGGLVVASFTGSDASGNPSSGNHNVDLWALFTGIEGSTFDAVRFNTTRPAFESADHRVAAVPVPATAGLLALGLVGLGLFRRRRSV